MTSTTAKPLVTIITPARNAAEDLGGALESVRQQKVENFQHIIVDDGSTDSTPRILEDASRNDPRILQLRSEGIGPAAARNFALSHAEAPLVAFLDADDRWRPGKLQRQLDFHQANPDVVLSFTDYEHLTPEGKSLGGSFEYWPEYRSLADTGPDYARIEDGAPLIFAENAVGTSTVACRREIFDTAGVFRPDLRSASDWEMWLRLALAGPVGYSTDMTTDYLVMPGSVTSNRGLRIACMEQIIDSFTPEMNTRAPRSVRTAKARIEVAKAEMAREDESFMRAFAHHVNALRLNPNRRTARAAAADLRSMLKAA